MRSLALLLMVASGCASLGYEIVWTEQSSLWLGHESAAVLAVTAAFFGGLALGALVISPRIERSARPAHWYAGCEALIGLWSLALAFLFGPVTNGLLALIGAQPSPVWHWAVAFCGIFLLLLPATAPMGATLPAMDRVLARERRAGSSVAALYAGNTFGAMLGVLATAFVLVPQFGLLRTAVVCATLSLICAVVATRLFSAPEALPATSPMALPASTEARHSLRALALTGLLGIGYEVLAVRVLSQVAENTVFTFAILLAVYLAGTALGAAIYSRWRASGEASERLLLATGGACLIGMVAMAEAGAIKAAVLAMLGAGSGQASALAGAATGAGASAVHAAMGARMWAALVAEAVLAVAAFLLPTIAMGALFSHLCTRASEQGISFGRALGVNTLGAALAPPVFGVVLVPLIGSKLAILVIVAGYAALASRALWTTAAGWTTAAAALAIAIWGPSLAIVDIPEGGRLVSHEEGAMASVSIVEDARGVASLHINNRQQEGSSATVFADARQALLPVLLHASPYRALFLGLGTGVTSSAAASDPGLEVDAVELLPEVIDASVFFTQRVNLGDPGARLHLMAADARRFVRASGNHYDVIVADNFHPARSGSGALYTIEHFNAVKARLAANGLFCQWLPLHQLDLDTLRSIVRTFLIAFPHGWAMLATNSLETPVIGLIGRNDGENFDVAKVRNRLATAMSTPSAADLGIGDDFAVLGSFIAGSRSLEHFSARAPLNTDNRPVVAYLAPRITYAPDSEPRDRLIALLRELNIEPEDLLTPGGDRAWESRLASYWSARDRFIEAGRNVTPEGDVRRMLGQVRAPLLDVLHISPDFRPAYEPLLRMADALGEVDAPAAQALKDEISAVRRPDEAAAQPAAQ